MARKSTPNQRPNHTSKTIRSAHKPTVLWPLGRRYKNSNNSIRARKQTRSTNTANRTANDQGN